MDALAAPGKAVSDCPARRGPTDQCDGASGRSVSAEPNRHMCSASRTRIHRYDDFCDGYLTSCGIGAKLAVCSPTKTWLAQPRPQRRIILGLA